MSNGFGPLLWNLDTIRYEDREYWLGCSWTSWGSWVEIDGVQQSDVDKNRGRVCLPDEVACKIAAAILYAEVYNCRDNQTTPLGNAFADADQQESFTRALKRILADELAGNDAELSDNADVDF